MHIVVMGNGHRGIDI